MLKFEEYKKSVNEELKDVRFISEAVVNDIIFESYKVIVDNICKVIYKNMRNFDSFTSEDEILFTKNEVGFYLNLEDRKEGRIDGGNGYTGYTYNSYSVTIQDKLKRLINDKTEEEFENFKLIGFEDKYVENYHILEDVLIDSVELFENDSTEEYIFKKEHTKMKKLFKVTSVGTVELTQEQLENFESGHIEDIVCLVRMEDGSTVTLKADIENEVGFSNLEE